MFASRAVGHTDTEMPAVVGVSTEIPRSRKHICRTGPPGKAPELARKQKESEGKVEVRAFVVVLPGRNG